MSLRELVEFLKANEIAEFDMEQARSEGADQVCGRAAAAATGASIWRSWRG